MKDIKILLPEKEIPATYLNISYYLKKFMNKLPDPPLNPVTKSPVKAEDLVAIFPSELINQEMSHEREIRIPDKVRELYRMYRPSPLFRARKLERCLQTPAHIYYKYEGNNPSGSHKLNTALAQAYYNKKEGVKALITETGAGQWGAALSLACNYFGIACEVFMVRVSYDQKPYRRVLMEIFNGRVHASPSSLTQYGRKVLNLDPKSSGSLGIAISEALEVVMKKNNSRYALGSVLNHVLLHQTIVGQELKKQMEIVGEMPDVIVGCCGGGSNFAGVVFPFLADQLMGGKKIRYVGTEPDSCPSLTKGQYRYDFGDASGMTPLLKMKTMGAEYIPSPSHAGGLRYHGMAPLISFLHSEKLIEAKSYSQNDIFNAGAEFAGIEGIVPAPESAYAIKGAIDEALTCRDEGKKKVIVLNLSGHGLLDLKGYDDFLKRKI